MTSTDLVRSSRDGDQFHYYWAARQCLKLLLPGSGLAAVSIEGSSPEDPMAADGQGPDDDPTGEYVVDIAEYYGDAAPDAADKIVYRQLKHSTEHADQPWTVSGLKNTLEGFGRRFSALGDASPGLRERVSFEFVSNRPVDDAVIRALSDIGQGASPASPQDSRVHPGLPGAARGPGAAVLPAVHGRCARTGAAAAGPLVPAGRRRPPARSAE